MSGGVVAWSDLDPATKEQLRVVLVGRGEAREAVVEVFAPDALGEGSWHRTQAQHLVRAALRGVAERALADLAAAAEGQQAQEVLGLVADALGHELEGEGLLGAVDAALAPARKRKVSTD